MSTEATVAAHYGRNKLEESILTAVVREGKDPEKLAAADLAAVDEFHVGGLEATQELAAQMELRPGLRLLDVGSGLGGPARYLASEHGCKVTGIDLTQEFVDAARSLSKRVKLDGLVDFQQGSALRMPFAPDTFDGAYMIHVGMNIADKAGIFREVRRVLKKGALFTVFDFVRSREGAIHFPVPWALSEESSFVARVKDYRDALEGAGFRVEKKRERQAFSIAFLERAMARMAQSGPPALGLHLLMGEQAPTMARNMLAMMKEGILEPVELFSRAV
ncbi:MAG TPA: class I SAM-dependent methyltransferase [Bryobacteraceae bacterium]|nr:class I SAM-dependent methyltransferase [Bryobacteraceae bacterium]